MPPSVPARRRIAIPERPGFVVLPLASRLQRSPFDCSLAIQAFLHAIPEIEKTLDYTFDDKVPFRSLFELLLNSHVYLLIDVGG